MTTSYKAVRRLVSLNSAQGQLTLKAKKKVAAKLKAYRFASALDGAATIFDVMGPKANRICGYSFGGTLADDSKKLSDDLRTIGSDFKVVVARMAADAKLKAHG